MKAVKFTLLNFIIAILLCSLAISAPVKDYPLSLVQPSGETIQVYVTGDEYYRLVFDKEGYTVIQDGNTGYYVYANLVNDVLVPTKFIVGKINPSLMGLSKGLDISSEKIKEIYKKKTADRQPGCGPKTGTINNLVVFVRFSGESEFADAISIYNNLYNNSSPGYNSMQNYYKEVSFNLLTISSTYYPPPATYVVSYQDSHQRGYFQPYSSTNTIGYQNSAQSKDREHALLRDAANYIANMVPTGLNLDIDNDGNVDGINYIIKGDPGGWSDLLWPHMWTLSSYSVYIRGKRIWVYDFQIQNMLLGNTYGVGVLCHEMFHVIGAPDLYHYYYSKDINPVYRWDVMENTTNPPQHIGAYMNFRYGTWINSIPTITTSGTYTLNPITSQTNNAFKIPSPVSDSEYFVVEYRKKSITRFEDSIPGSGLLVYRINAHYYCFGQGNTFGPPDEVYIYRPGGTPTANGSPGYAHYTSDAGRTAINSTTNPFPWLEQGEQGGLNISNIGSAGSTISFYVTVNTAPPGPQIIMEESFENVTFPPSNWVKAQLTGATGWNRQLVGTSPVPGFGGGSITGISGGASAVAFCNYITGNANNGISGPSNQWLISQQVTNVQASDSLIFYVRKYGTYLDNFFVQVSTTDQNPTSFTTILLNHTFQANDTGWFKVSLKVGGNVPLGSNIYIAFIEYVADVSIDGASFELDFIRFIRRSTNIRSDNENIPIKYSLLQNYPNPFNPVTNIKFGLPTSSYVKLVIYDILGREREVLVNAKLKAGNYVVDWNASGYPSGTYFYRLETSSFTAVKKMMLIK